VVKAEPVWLAPKANSANSLPSQGITVAFEPDRLARLFIQKWRKIRCMRCVTFVGALLILVSAASAQEPSPGAEQPGQFEIGVHSFFDFGPPFHYYELFVVRPAANGASIDRITLTPSGIGCHSHPEIETKAVSIDESTARLLGSTNPCTIPEKELRRELKRCKKCHGFSGANVVLQVQCGTQNRLIRSDILDRDMFDPAANTPEHTSWTMRLLASLNRAVGPGVMERPIFPVAEGGEHPTNDSDSANLQDVGDGKYDDLFPAAPDTPSDLYRASLPAAAQPEPSVRLVSSIPYDPQAFVLPVFPPIAIPLHAVGTVTITIQIDANGNVKDMLIYTGQPLFRHAVENTLTMWKYPMDAANKLIQVTLEYELNCPEQHALHSEPGQP
jgi:hypothetical protein